MSSYTKKQLVNEAYSELALSDYQFDLTPEEMQTALRRMDMMLANWNGIGIRLGYPISNSTANSTLEQDSNLPDWAIEAVVTNLAVRLAPGNGKQLIQDTRITAKNSYNVLLSRFANSVPQQFPGTLPSGAGNKPWRSNYREFFPEPCEPVLAGRDGPIKFS